MCASENVLTFDLLFSTAVLTHTITCGEMTVVLEYHNRIVSHVPQSRYIDSIVLPQLRDKTMVVLKSKDTLIEVSLE